MKTIRCERTRQFIQSFGEQSSLNWDQIIPARPTNEDALDLIAKMLTMDPYKRTNVHGALSHPFLRNYFPSISVEPVCPFKVISKFIILWVGFRSSHLCENLLKGRGHILGSIFSLQHSILRTKLPLFGDFEKILPRE